MKMQLIQEENATTTESTTIESLEKSLSDVKDDDSVTMQDQPAYHVEKIFESKVKNELGAQKFNEIDSKNLGDDENESSSNIALKTKEYKIEIANQLNGQLKTHELNEANGK